MPQFDPFLIVNNVFYILVFFFLLLVTQWIYNLPAYSSTMKLRAKLISPSSNKVSTRDDLNIEGKDYPAFLGLNHQ